MSKVEGGGRGQLTPLPCPLKCSYNYFSSKLLGQESGFKKLQIRIPGSLDMRCGRKANPHKKFAGSKLFGYVWTGTESRRGHFYDDINLLQIPERFTNFFLILNFILP